MLVMEPRFEDPGLEELGSSKLSLSPSPEAHSRPRKWDAPGEKGGRRQELQVPSQPPARQLLFQAVLLVSATPWWQQAWSWPGLLSLVDPSFHLDTVRRFKSLHILSPREPASRNLIQEKNHGCIPGCTLHRLSVRG